MGGWLYHVMKKIINVWSGKEGFDQIDLSLSYQKECTLGSHPYFATSPVEYSLKHVDATLKAFGRSVQSTRPLHSWIFLFNSKMK